MPVHTITDAMLDERLVEIAARALHHFVMPDGDRLGDLLHQSEYIRGDQPLAGQIADCMAIWSDAARAVIAAIAPAIRTEEREAPIDMLLWCPGCGVQHIDAPEDDWTNPPHKSHLCRGCGAIWRPADVATNGVAQIATRGSADTWPEAAAAAIRASSEGLEG